MLLSFTTLLIIYKLCISNAPRPSLVAVIKVRFFNTDVYGEKQLLFCTSMLKIVDRNPVIFLCIIKSTMIYLLFAFLTVQGEEPLIVLYCCTMYHLYKYITVIYH